MLVAVAGGAATVLSQRPEGQPAAAAEASPFEQARRTGVQDLLNRWAKAVRSGDDAALVGLFDAGAAPEFLAAEVRRSHNLAGVPLADWGYEIGSGPETPVPSDIADRLQATDVWAPHVFLRYGIAGADTASTRKPVSLVVARRGDEWKLVSDGALPQYDRSTWRGPWDFGPVVARTVETDGGVSVVLGHPWQQARVDAIAAELVTAVPAVTEVWGTQWPRRALVIVAADQEEFTQQVGEEHSGSDIAAVSISDAVVPGATTVTGQRIVFSPTAGERLTEASRRAVLRHELTHVAARATTVDGSPMWVLEGFADYVGHRGSGATVPQIAPTVSAAVAVHGPPVRLPSDADFAAGGERSLAAYESAWTVAEFVADRFGEDELRSLYGELATGPADDATIDDRVRSAIGVPTQELIGQWGTWLADNVR
ncbi:hypothetical protein [Rhodococcus triatomae]